MAGVQELYRQAKKHKKSVTVKEVESWLNDQEVHTLHRARLKRVKRNKVTAIGLNTHIAIDLIDLSKYKSMNNNYSWILLSICSFSRSVRYRALKSKRATDVLPALQSIIQSYPNVVWYVLSDDGNEFKSVVKEYLAERGIVHVILRGEQKNSQAENAVKNLMGRIGRHFTRTQRKNWLDVLDDLERAVNNSYVRPLKAKPNDINSINEGYYYKKLYGENKLVTRHKYKKGSSVRISTPKGIFEKGYTPNYTKEIYFIDNVLGRYPETYTLVDSKGVSLKRPYLQTELVPAGTSSSSQRK